MFLPSSIYDLEFNQKPVFQSRLCKSEDKTCMQNHHGNTMNINDKDLKYPWLR